MLSLGEVIGDVRSMHPAFDTTRVPNVVLAHQLSTYQGVLIRKITFRNKEVLAKTVQIPCPSTIDVTQPLPGLPPLEAIVQSTVIVQGDTNLPTRLPLPIVTLTRRTLAGRSLSLVDDQVFLNGSQTDWVPTVQTIELQYIPQATRLTRLEDVFVVPEAARDCLAAYGGKVAAVRAKQFEPGVDTAYFITEAARAQTDYLHALRLSKGSQYAIRRDGNDDYDD